MPGSRPNIIYIVPHDLGKHLNCYGVEGVTSPGLDRFAREGVLFDNAFCSSPCCSPSRGCAMTGQYAHTNGLMGLINLGWSMPEKTRTIVDYLNEAGYETAHFGFQHERYHPAANRYQVEGVPFYPWHDPFPRDEEWIENVVDRAVTYLESRVGSDRPFYLNAGSLEVHSSRWQGPTHYPEGNPENRHVVYGVDPHDRVYMPRYIPDTPQLREMMGRFQGAIRYLDSHVQRLFDAVERLGYRDNTLVIFTTDHGIANMRAKSWLYDRGVEITLMMRLPGTIPQGHVVSDLIPNIDIAPTILEAAGVEIPPAMQGRSFWSRLTGGEYAPHDAIYIEKNYHGAYDPVRAVRTPRYHYIRNLDPEARRAWLPGDVPTMNESFEGWYNELWPEPSLPRDEEELFDIVNDPDEFTNLADDPAHQEIRNRLALQLRRWMEETDDPLLQGPIPPRLNPWPDQEG